MITWVGGQVGQRVLQRGKKKKRKNMNNENEKVTKKKKKTCGKFSYISLSKNYTRSHSQKGLIFLLTSLTTWVILLFCSLQQTFLLTTDSLWLMIKALPWSCHLWLSFLWHDYSDQSYLGHITSARNFYGTTVATKVLLWSYHVWLWSLWHDHSDQNLTLAT